MTKTEYFIRFSRRIEKYIFLHLTTQQREVEPCGGRTDGAARSSPQVQQNVDPVFHLIWFRLVLIRMKQRQCGSRFGKELRFWLMSPRKR